MPRLSRSALQTQLVGAKAPVRQPCRPADTPADAPGPANQRAETPSSANSRSGSILASRLVAAYESDQTPLLEQMLTAHSLTDALSRPPTTHSVAGRQGPRRRDLGGPEDAGPDTPNVQMASAPTPIVGRGGRPEAPADDEKAKVDRGQEQPGESPGRSSTNSWPSSRRATKLASTRRRSGRRHQVQRQAIDQLWRARSTSWSGSRAARARSRRSTTVKLKWPMSGVITPEVRLHRRVSSEPRVGQLRPLPPGHRHRGAVLTRRSTPRAAAWSSSSATTRTTRRRQAWLVIIAHSTSMVTWYAHMTAKAHGGHLRGRDSRDRASWSVPRTPPATRQAATSTGPSASTATFMNPRLFL